LLKISIEEANATTSKENHFTIKELETLKNNLGSKGNPSALSDKIKNKVSATLQTEAGKK